MDPTSANFFGVNGQVSTMDFEEIRREQQSFDRLAAYLNGSTVNVTVDGRPQRYTGAYTTEDFLPSLGIQPMLGRDFTAADNVPGAERVGIIGYGIWQRDFGGSPDIVGRNVRINGKPATIIGVMPQGFAFPTNEELWLPLYGDFPPKPRNDPSNVNPALLGTLKPGVSIDQATAEFTTFRQAARRRVSGNQQTVQHRPGAVADRELHAAAAARHAADHAGVLRRRAADRMRQRDEHAVRARDAARRRDPLIYAAVAGLVTIVALAATFVPARRATRVDPMYVLRME